jgi:hypothetical protein
LGAVVYGRVAYGIGRRPPFGRFKSLLLIVEASNLDRALPQLVVYLGSLYQSRLQRNQGDATVYGVVSDGYAFIFLTITHGGELKRSRRFDINEGEVMLQTVLGCVKYILETSAKMTSEVEDHDSDLDADNHDNVSPSPE